MERETFFNLIDDVDGYDSAGLNSKARQPIINSVTRQIPGAEIKISEGSPVVVAGRPPEAVREAVEAILKSHTGRPLFPMRTALGTIELGVAFEKE